jgi:hypothetical protein
VASPLYRTQINFSISVINKLKCFAHPDGERKTAKIRIESPSSSEHQVIRPHDRFKSVKMTIRAENSFLFEVISFKNQNRAKIKML